jgi:hypothetical protein
MGAWEDFAESYNRSSFKDKVKYTRDVTMMSNRLSYAVSSISWYGYCKTETKYCVGVSGDEEYYVYLWRHAWGGPFYVGSGKGDRWVTKSPRCNDFYLHLNQADAVVYLVLSGVDSHTARLFEKYVSVNLIEGGYTLANGDNNTEYMTEQARERRIASCAEIDKHELAPKVQNAVLSILLDEPGCDYRATDEFLMRYGTEYFSNIFMKRNKKAR